MRSYVPAWWPSWAGAPMAIVASGPSAAGLDPSALRGLRTLAINSAIDLLPGADALYACDARWWELRRGCPGYRGVRITASRRARDAWGVNLALCDKATGDAPLMARRGTIGWGRNSGFQALNLALQFQPPVILLIGYDMHARAGLHCHPDHPVPLSNPRPESFRAWARAVDGVAPVARRFGVRVINCTPGSALEAFERMALGPASEIAVAVDEMPGEEPGGDRRSYEKRVEEKGEHLFHG